jgi:broad specificity phosphatase PhoE
VEKGAAIDQCKGNDRVDKYLPDRSVTGRSACGPEQAWNGKDRYYIVNTMACGMTACRACINEYKAPCQKGFYNIVISCYLQSMRAIITRHYKTIINASDQILGWGDSPRDKGWRADVELLGIHLIHDTPALNEVNYGKLYKKKKKWVAEHYPRHKKDPDLVYPKGESFRQMQQRSVSYISSLAKTHPQQTVLVVVHAGVIRGLVSHFLGLNYADNLSHRISHRYIGDFVFDEESCVRYDELGKLSGFVRDGVIETPFSCPVIDAAVISAGLQSAPKTSTRSAGDL